MHLISCRYVYVYVEYLHYQTIMKANAKLLGESFQCFEPKVVSLERTGTIKIVTISALISHFLPYFNSSINPIIYNIMSGKCSKENQNRYPSFLRLDKFRLKFRELFSSCCCCCKSFVRMKSTSSPMIPFKASCTLQHTSQQPSPILTDQVNRSTVNHPSNRSGNNSLMIHMANHPTLPNHNGKTSSIKSLNHNAYTSRLTNV